MREARTIELDEGRSLHAVTAGEGPDLVLLHGALATHQDWLAGPFDRLAGEFRVTALDRPGHGQSRRPRFDGTPREQAAQIRAGLKLLGTDRATLVGHSLGGLVALAFAEQFPEAVEALVLVAPIAFPEPRLLEHLMLAPRAVPWAGPLWSNFAEATIDRAMLELVQTLMFSPQPIPPHWKASYPYEAVLRPDAMVVEGEDSSAILPLAPTGLIDLSRIQVPVHIVTGTNDVIVDPNRHARPLSQLLRNVRLTELPGIGHMPHHVAADAVIAAIRETVREPSPSAL